MPRIQKQQFVRELVWSNMNSEDFSYVYRENNSLRKFIVINKIQGKHFPCSPTVTDAEFSKHAENVKRFASENGINSKNCIVIGFAETAVAIGAYIAREMSAFYVSTTRERLPDCFERITFEESHSHAVEHSLCIRDKNVFRNADCVIIADDEFTTGKTAVKLAKALEKYIPSGCPIITASFIASSESRTRFAENGIFCFAEYKLDDICECFDEGKSISDTAFEPWYSTAEIKLNSVLDFRLGVNAREYFAECERLCAKLWEKLGGSEFECEDEVSFIGTEELCLPPIIIGKMFEEHGILVSVQGITRSPMIPIKRNDYPIKSRMKLKSLYDSERDVFLYNKFCGCNVTVIITDAVDPDPEAVRMLCGAVDGFVRLVYWRGKKMQTSLKKEDCTLLLKDITGLIKPMSAKERESLIQSGVHYSELLPAEYHPSGEYIKQFERGLSEWSGKTADAVRIVAERIYAKGRNVIVSLARAGTPIGVLIVRYLRRKYGSGFVHYSISIIRGKGIDENALQYILARHSPEKIQFVDGWTGKGAITNQLKEALKNFHEINPLPAVLADPAGVCEICGTREDIFIPCACLNAVVSGLFSRTVLRDDIILDGDFHGAVYFPELVEKDRTYEFIQAVEEKMNYDEISLVDEPFDYGCGLRETEEIARTFGVSDINLVKPGIGETTRVLLRRIPKLILVDKLGSPLTAHIEELAAEKGVEIREYPLKYYHACGIIQVMGDI